VRVYADSSFIVSIYNPQPQTPRALRRLKEIRTAGDSILLCDLARLEVTNAFQLGIFRGVVTEPEAKALLGTFDANIATGAFRLLASPHSMWKTAGELSMKHVGSSGCRSLDVLHVAIALLLNAELFLTFDNRQRALALAAGLNAPDLLSADYS
jgi:predicted nucleic acid-binding protein